MLPAIQSEPRSTLAGIVTRDPAKAEPYHVPAWTDLHAALRESEADAVYVATPVALHAPQSIAALMAGKHVLCEKPTALNYAEAASIQNVAEETGRTFGVAYYRRMYPRVQQAKAQIESGAIGRPVLADAFFHDWFYPEDGFRSWLLDPQMAGGGPLYDVASHRIDLMNYFCGTPKRVTGQLSTLVHPIRVEDNATVLIEYESGVRAIVDVRWHSKVQRDEFRIRGTAGEIDLTPLSAPPVHANLHYPCVENFVSAILEGTPLASSGQSAIWTDWITEQAVAAHAH